MRSKTLAIVLSAVAVVALAIPRVAPAHHNFTTTYDGSKLITLTGKVTEFKYQNPHIEIHLEVTRADGVKEMWEITSEPPGQAAKKGIRKESLKPGDSITATGWPARNGDKEMGGHTLTLPDGREVMLRESTKRPRGKDQK
jgi:hypothetical protein